MLGAPPPSSDPTPGSRRRRTLRARFAGFSKPHPDLRPIVESLALRQSHETSLRQNGHGHRPDLVCCFDELDHGARDRRPARDSAEQVGEWVAEAGEQFAPV